MPKLIDPTLRIALENIIDGALGEMIDAATDMALSAVEAGLDQTDLQIPVAGLSKTADQVMAETIADLERALIPFLKTR